MRRAGDHVRITAQLIDADTDSHLWSETYDREMKDVFAIQDDIAHSIVKALQVTLTPQERRSIQFVATVRSRGLRLLPARPQLHVFDGAARLSRTRSGCSNRRSASIPKYALAYAGIADAYSHLYRYMEATQENVEHANRASEQAVALDPDSAEAHASRGLALFISEQYDECAARIRHRGRAQP